ncbi:MAG: peptide-methionine (R)-S-oxide reductase MsrB [Acidimicrobiia bacterium]|nr:peptide-methionine (R)-S-oxide reductase MsrB [Acidimicrobiia bacterium]
MSDSLPSDPTERAEALRQRLSEEQFQVTQCSATERAFTGKYWDCHDDGTYHCIVCDAQLFSSDTKFDSGTGWPSFFDPMTNDAVATVVDTSHGMARTEAICAACSAHLGHVFDDGPGPTGLRYCMNSASLDLKPAQN